MKGGDKKFGMSFESQPCAKTNLVAECPGILDGMSRERPKVREKKLCSIVGPYPQYCWQVHDQL